jgi:hypothetical protein
VTSAGSSGTSATPLVREFIYLNQAKVFSYLSQMEGGLKLLYSKVHEDSWSETVAEAENVTERGASLTGTFEAKIALLAGMTGEATADWKNSVKSGGDARTDGERSVTSDLFGLHHKAFDLVMQAMGSRLATYSGKIVFIDTDFVIRNIKDFPAIARELKAISGENIVPMANTKEMSSLMDRYLSGKVVVIMRLDDGRKITAYLDKEHLHSNIESTIMDYGYAPVSRFTLVGINAPAQQQGLAGDFSVPHYVPEGVAMAAQLPAMAGSLAGMAEFLQAKSRDGHVVPLALYVEI